MRALAQAAWPRRTERSRLVLSVLLAAGATGAAIALLASSGYLISRAAQRPQIISLMVTIVAVRAFGIARAALRYGERLASHDLALRQLARLRSTFYARLAMVGSGRLARRGRGELLAAFVSDVDTLQDAHLRVVIPVLVAGLVVLGAGAAAWLMLGAAGVAVLISLGLTAIVCTWISGAVAAVSGRNQAPARARLSTELVEAIDGSAELALTGSTGTQVERLRRSDAELGRLARRDALAGALATTTHSLLTGAGLLAVLLVAIDGVRSGSLPAVLLAAVAFLYLGACESLLPLPTAARRLLACQTSAARLHEVCSQRPTVVDPPRPRRPSGHGELALEGVTMHYGDDRAPLLGSVNLRLAPGEHVALTGPSGAGKTTLAELLVRFNDPRAGRVTLDGIDLRDLTTDELRGAVRLCAQDAHLFNTTIRENLLIGGRDASDRELWDALAVVELDEWAAGLTDRLDTIVGQHGELVSGGQRQRLALARALIGDARFLILDEPLAHLDAALARRVIERLLQHTRAQTVLAVTHATDALESFDRVIRLERGALRPLEPAMNEKERSDGPDLLRRLA